METLAVNVCQAEGLESQTSVCFCDPENAAERYAVPFTAPVLVSTDGDLALWFVAGSEKVGRATITVGNLPMGTWVTLDPAPASTGAPEDIAPPRAFITIARPLDDQSELPSVDHSLLRSSEASFVSTASVQPTTDDLCTRTSLRQTLEQLQEKLERDRQRHSGKTKALQLKLISVRSAYEKDLWKFKLDRNHLERCFRLETNELKLGLEKATMGRRRDALLAEELKAKAQSLQAELLQEREQRLALSRKYDDLCQAYEQSNERLMQQHQSLLSELEQSATAKLLADLSAAQSRILALETTNFQLEQEIKRLKAIPSEKCEHEFELQQLRLQLEESEKQRLALPDLVAAVEESLAAGFAVSLKKVEDDRCSDRKALLSVIEDLRSELNQTRRSAVSLQTREAALATKLDSKRYAVLLQKDLRTELEEALALNSRFTVDLAEVNERLEAAEKLTRAKEAESAEWQRKCEELQMELKNSEDTNRQIALGLSDASTSTAALNAKVATLTSALDSAAQALKSEQEKSTYLEAELTVSQEVMKTLKVTHETESKEAQHALRDLQERVAALEKLAKEWETKHTTAIAQVQALQEAQRSAQDFSSAKDKDVGSLRKRMEELESALRESEAHCARLEDETQSLAEKFTAEREELDYYTQGLLDENQDLKRLFAAAKEEKEELERLLNEAVSKIPAPKSDSKDLIDQMLREYMTAHKMKNPFIRIAEGLYTYGSKKVSVTVKNGSLIIRVGGGYMFIEEFLKMYLPNRKTEEAPTPRKVKLVVSPREFNARSQSVGTEFKRTFTLLCESRTREETSESSSGFPTPQRSVDSPLRTQRSIREVSPTLFLPTVSSQNKSVGSPMAAKTTVFRAFKVGRSDA